MSDAGSKIASIGGTDSLYWFVLFLVLCTCYAGIRRLMDWIIQANRKRFEEPRPKPGEAELGLAKKLRENGERKYWARIDNKK